MNSDRKGEQAPHSCLLVLSHVIVSSDNPPVMSFILILLFNHISSDMLVCCFSAWSVVWHTILLGGETVFGKQHKSKIDINARIQSLQRLCVYRRIILLQRIITIIFHGVQHARPSCFFHIALTPLDSAVQLILFYFFNPCPFSTLMSEFTQQTQTTSDVTLQTKVNIWKAQTPVSFFWRVTLLTTINCGSESVYVMKGKIQLSTSEKS